MFDKNKELDARSRFGIRKTALGVGSILLGFTLMGNMAHAEETETDDKTEWVSVEDTFEETVEEVKFEETKEVEPVTETVSEENIAIAEEEVVDEKEKVAERDLTAYKVEGIGSFDVFFSELDREEELSKPASSTLENKSLADIKADQNVTGVYKDGSEIIVANNLETDVSGNTSTRTEGGGGRDIIFIVDESGSMSVDSVVGDLETRTPTKRVNDIINSLISSMGEDDRIAFVPVDTNNNMDRVSTPFYTKGEIPRDLFETDNLGLYTISKRISPYSSGNSEESPSLANLDSSKTYALWFVDEWTSPSDAVDTSFLDFIQNKTKKLITYAFTSKLNDNHRMLPSVNMVNKENPLTDAEILSAIDAETKVITNTTYKPITVNVDTKGLQVESIELIKPDGSKTPINNGDTFTPTANGKHKVRYILKGSEPSATTTYTGKLTDGATELVKKDDTYTHVHVPVVNKEEETETEAIPFKKEQRTNPDLPVGETKVVQQGKDGVKTIYFEVTVTDGVKGERKKVREEVTTEPVSEITEVGTRNERERVETQPVPHGSVEKPDFTMNKGERREIKGSEGIRTIVYTEVYDGDNKVSESVKSDSITTQPVDTIILVGTREVRERLQIVPVPNKTVEKKTFDMMKGERKEIIGHLGIKNIYHEEIYDGSRLDSTKVLREEITTEPVDTVILIGTKEIKERIETQPVPFKRIQKKTADLFVGETRLFKGKEGIRTIVHEEIYDEDRLDSTKVLSDKITTEPIDEIEWIGVKEIKERKESNPIPYEVERVETDELPLGVERIKQTGVAGLETVTYRELWIDGKLVKTEETKRERVSPIQEIIEVGTHVEEEVMECPVPEVIDPMPVGELPATGEADMVGIFSTASLSILAGLGLVSGGKKKEDE